LKKLKIILAIETEIIIKKQFSLYSKGVPKNIKKLKEINIIRKIMLSLLQVFATRY
jgi:hypothetical protein